MERGRVVEQGYDALGERDGARHLALLNENGREAGRGKAFKEKAEAVGEEWAVSGIFVGQQVGSGNFVAQQFQRHGERIHPRFYGIKVPSLGGIASGMRLK
jgi:hypothetical protein